LTFDLCAHFCLTVSFWIKGIFQNSTGNSQRHRKTGQRSTKSTSQAEHKHREETTDNGSRRSGGTKRAHLCPGKSIHGMHKGSLRGLGMREGGYGVLECVSLVILIYMANDESDGYNVWDDMDTATRS